MTWKYNDPFKATYESLLRLCCEKRVSYVADTICEVLLKSRKEQPQGNKRGKAINDIVC